MDSKCKKCRREGEKLMLKGDRCIGPKCSVTRRSYGPGQHGPTRRTKMTEYGRQLREKQKLKSIFGISEGVLLKYYNQAVKSPGNTTEDLMTILESRIDNLIYRAGLCSSKSEARQKVSHGLVILNGKKITIPSILVKVGDKISWKFAQQKQSNKFVPPGWIKVDVDKKKIEVLHLPTHDEIDLPVNESLVVEYYSR